MAVSKEVGFWEIGGRKPPKTEIWVKRGFPRLGQGFNLGIWNPGGQRLGNFSEPKGKPLGKGEIQGALGPNKIVCVDEGGSLSHINTQKSFSREYFSPEKDFFSHTS